MPPRQAVERPTLIPNRIRQVRGLMRQGELAEAAGIERVRMSLIETGQALASPAELDGIGKVLGQPVRAFYPQVTITAAGSASGSTRRGLSLEQAYRDWRRTADGEVVYASARDRAKQLRRAGWRHYSIRPIIEAIRYDRAIQVGPDHGYKINDHQAPYLARELMRSEPELADFFALRALRGL